MLITECVEQKKKCKGQKWGGLLPISSLGSRHCSGVTLRGTAACMAGAPARMTKDLRAIAGVHRKVCRDMPPWLLCRDREFPVMTELAHPVSRQGFLMSRQGLGS